EVRVAPLSILLTLTLASAIAAPVASRTWPEMVAVTWAWATERVARKTTIIVAQAFLPAVSRFFSTFVVTRPQPPARMPAQQARMPAPRWSWQLLFTLCIGTNRTFRSCRLKAGGYPVGPSIARSWWRRHGGNRWCE